MDALRFGRRHLRACVVLSLFVLAVSGFCGCANVWDEITSRDFSLNTWYSPPDPLTVLHDSNDGDKRAQALRSLKEPKQTGGTDKDQDAILQILGTAAKTERAALCRLAAIEALQHFKDPRAVTALEAAYYNSGSIEKESALIIRCRAIEAMGETYRPEAVPILVRIANPPPVAPTAPETEKQQRAEERIAVARALGHFKGRQVTEALVALLRSDPDVALRSCAHQSLQDATGRNFPADQPQLWAEYLKSGGQEQDVITANEKSTGDKIITYIRQTGASFQ